MNHTLLFFIILCGLSLGAQVTFVIEAYGAPAIEPIGNFAVKEHGEGSGFFELNQHTGQEYGINIGYMLRKYLEIGIGTTYMKYGYSFNRYSTHVNYDDVFVDRNSGSVFTEMYGAKPYIRTQLTDRVFVSLAFHLNQEILYIYIDPNQVCLQVYFSILALIQVESLICLILESTKGLCQLMTIFPIVYLNWEHRSRSSVD